MHYPVITEKHLVDRWQVSLKTLRRWRLKGEGPVWHKLSHHVRYHEADILELEHRSAQHLAADVPAPDSLTVTSSAVPIRLAV